jgi:ketosteroid isomerase-like protein
MYAWIVGKVIRRTYREVTAGDPRMVRLLAADDIEFVFPGENSFGGTYRGKPAMLAWIDRFASLQPQLTVHDVVVSGPPWDMRVGMRFTDHIGEDYTNDGMEYVRIRWGKVRSIEVYLNTESISRWEQRHPELVATG